MNSPSILSQLLKNSKSNLLPEFLSFENFHDIQVKKKLFKYN